MESAPPATAREVAGATTSEAARLANEAAGIVVGRFGPSTVTAAELLKTFEVAGELGS